MKRPRFLLTANLTRLAKWLRFLGYDAAVREHLDFDALVAQAARQRRILLTRSRQQSNDPRHFRRLRVISDQHADQIRELREVIVFDETMLFTRCGECNRVLRTISRESVADRVPERVIASHEEFRRCPHCHRVYWRGNHWKEIRDLLFSALQ